MAEWSFRKPRFDWEFKELGHQHDKYLFIVQRRKTKYRNELRCPLCKEIVPESILFQISLDEEKTRAGYSHFSLGWMYYHDLNHGDESSKILPMRLNDKRLGKHVKKNQELMAVIRRDARNYNQWRKENEQRINVSKADKAQGCP